MNSWIPLDQVVFTNEIQALSCDTRDFACILSDAEEIPDISTLGKYPDRFFFTIQEVEQLLKRLFTESGGEKDWRFLQLINTKIPTGDWKLKYIRVYCTPMGYVLGERSEKVFNKEFWNSPVKTPY